MTFSCWKAEPNDAALLNASMGMQQTWPTCPISQRMRHEQARRVRRWEVCAFHRMHRPSSAQQSWMHYPITEGEWGWEQSLDSLIHNPLGTATQFSEARQSSASHDHPCRRSRKEWCRGYTKRHPVIIRPYLPGVCLPPLECEHSEGNSVCPVCF